MENFFHFGDTVTRVSSIVFLNFVEEDSFASGERTKHHKLEVYLAGVPTPIYFNYKENKELAISKYKELYELMTGEAYK